MKCPYCGAEIEDGAKFCTNCGKSLDDPEFAGVGDEPSKKSMEKAIHIIVIAAAVLITVVLSIALGIRSFISREYKNALTAYEAGDYEGAIDSLSHVVRWGYNDDYYVLLANSYYHDAQYDKAYETYEKVNEAVLESEDAVKGYADTCERLAYQAVADSDSDLAAAYLQKEYELTGDERIQRRIKAIEGGGNFADEHGNIYNLAGLLETAVCYDGNGRELYRAELIYGADGKWQFAKAFELNRTRKSVFGTFDWDETGELVLSVYPDSDGYSWMSRKTERNSDGLVRRVTSLDIASKEILSFDYSKNTKGFPEKETITSSSGETMNIEWTGEEYPDHAVITVNGETYVAVITYGADGQAETVNITKNLLQTVYQRTNVYGEDGTLTEETVKNNGMPFSLRNPGGSYTRTVTEYSAHQPVSRTVYNEKGRVIARGYYIDGCGWLMMYTGE